MQLHAVNCSEGKVHNLPHQHTHTNTHTNRHRHTHILSVFQCFKKAYVSTDLLNQLLVMELCSSIQVVNFKFFVANVVYVCVHVGVCGVYMSEYISVFVCVCVCVCVCVYIYLYVCVCVYLYVLLLLEIKVRCSTSH